jgi:septal ring factor EnvC (AmiA/AmiB activator)
MKKIILVICLLPVLHCRPSGADELSAVRSKIADVKKQDSAIAGQIKENEKVVLQTKKELVKTADELSRLESEKASVQEKIKTLEKRRDILSKHISETSARLADAAAGFVAVGTTPPSFDESDANGYVLAMALLSSVSSQFDEDIKIALAEIKELDKLQAELEKQRGTFAEYEKRHKRQQADLDKLLRARSEQNHALRGQQQELQKKLGGLSARAKNLSELADKVAPNLPAAAGEWRRGMKFPVSGMLLLRFGDANSSGLKSDGWRVRSNPDAIVVAPAAGKLEFADYFHIYTHIAIINHDNGYLSVLTGMAALNVLIGQEVMAGEPIGRMTASNPEMYMELRKNGRAVDPARWFKEPR